MNGLIFDVKRFSIHDGPGIRTTVFFKGCPLSCAWCQNPESISPEPEEIFRESRCIKCGKCSEGCYTGARETVGKTVTSEELLELLKKDVLFYRESGGGVTFSGGEPLMQCEFLGEMLELCSQEGFHTAVDTSGSAPWECFKSITELTGLFLYDLKHIDDDKHREFTGTGNKLVLTNLKKLVAAGVEVLIRIPVVAGFNDEISSMERTAGFLQELGPVAGVELLKCHDHASGKYIGLGRDVNCYVPSVDSVSKYRKILETAGLRVLSGG